MDKGLEVVRVRGMRRSVLEMFRILHEFAARVTDQKGSGEVVSEVCNKEKCGRRRGMTTGVHGEVPDLKAYSLVAGPVPGAEHEPLRCPTRDSQHQVRAVTRPFKSFKYSSMIAINFFLGYLASL